MDTEKREKSGKSIGVAANLGIILVAAACVFFLAKKHMHDGSSTRHAISIGTRFSLTNVNWQSSEKNLVLALSTGCQFCTESSGFYRALLDECRRWHVRTIAVLPQPNREAKFSLQNQGVIVDEIQQAALPDLDISATPTLLLIDTRGIIKNIWIGKLPSEKEREVIAKLTS